MTFKQFKRWCNDRACDGCWGYNDALYCIELVQNMMKIPWIVVGSFCLIYLFVFTIRNIWRGGKDGK